MASTLDMLAVLIVAIAILAAVAYLLTRLKFFREVLAGKVTWKSGFLLIIIFGLLSIFGTYASLEIMGAKANVRDLGPMIAGLVAGPFVGMGAGLIGSLQRLTLGGITAVPCAVATTLAGLIGGLIYLANRKRFVGVIGAVVFAILMECLHMLLIVLLVQPTSSAWEIVSTISIPMIVANAIGMAAFSLIFQRYRPKVPGFQKTRSPDPGRYEVK
ncbi:MAG: LytS/YhcK type 5TM receptor domain-containing protein [Methanomassiliicoccales archaeon]